MNNGNGGYSHLKQPDMFKKTAPQLLREAADTIEQRASERNQEQERSMKACVALFKALTGVELTETQGWQFMSCLKRARSSTGFKQDDYIDLIAYTALEAENVINEHL